MSLEHPKESVSDMTDKRTLFCTFLKIGAFTFGGGYAMIALLEREFIEKKKWLTRDEFLDMIAVAESTPGPMAINSATFVGYRLAGFAGAAASTIAVCIPSFFIIYCISLFFDRFLALSFVASAFRGIQVCVVYLILSAGLKMLRSMEKNHFSVLILCAVLAVMIFCSVTAVSFSSVFLILFSGVAGLAVSQVHKAARPSEKHSSEVHR